MATLEQAWSKSPAIRYVRKGDWYHVDRVEDRRVTSFYHIPTQFHVDNYDEILAAVSRTPFWMETEEGEEGESGVTVMTHSSGYVTPEGGYIESVSGNIINPGDPIALHFAGGPHDMPQPWTLVKAEDVFTTVSWSMKPQVTVRAADGTERIYSNAEVYSPMKGSHPL